MEEETTLLTPASHTPCCSSNSALSFLGTPLIVRLTAQRPHLQSYMSHVTHQKPTLRVPPGALTSFHSPSSPRHRNNFSVVTFHRNKFALHFLTAMAQIQHLDFASRPFPFYPPSLRRVLGRAGIGATPNLERSRLLLRAGSGRGVRGAERAKTKEALCTRWTPKVRDPFHFTPKSLTRFPLVPAPFLNIPQSHYKVSPRV